MKSIDLSDVAALTPHVAAGAHDPVLVTKDGATIAAVIPVTGEDAEQLLLSLSPQFQAILQRSEERLRQEGGLTTDELRRRLGLPAS
jgi:antitoxin (DNA-binding transcriptional repressor) of toxin-antitoxin stability system